MSKLMVKIALVGVFIALAFPTHDLLRHLVRGRMLRVQKINYNFSRYIRLRAEQENSPFPAQSFFIDSTRC